MKKRLLVLTLGLLAIFTFFNLSLRQEPTLIWALEIEKLIWIILLIVVSVYYLCQQARVTMYSYSLMSNLGILIFLVVTLGFQVYRLVLGVAGTPLSEVYQHILDSFSYYVMIMQPFALIFAGMLVISNLLLLHKEGWRWPNALGIFLGFILLVPSYLALRLFNLADHFWGPITDVYLDGVIYFFQAGICLWTAYLECLLISCVICTVAAERYQPSLDQDFIIILGCKVAADGQPLPLLQGRIERALQFARDQQTTSRRTLIFVPSGGQGLDEVTSEAESMKNYLLAQGVPVKKILIENQSTNTWENLKFSRRLIESENERARVVFATTGYHVFRSGVIAANQGFRVVGIGCPAPWYFYHNAILREFVANLVADWRKHLFNLSFLTLSIIGLLIYGYTHGLIAVGI